MGILTSLMFVSFILLLFVKEDLKRTDFELEERKKLENKIIYETDDDE